MKQSIIIAACMIFSVAGFSQTAESSTKATESKASCGKKEKAACCAHAEASKGCSDAKASAAVDGEAPKATISTSAATEPRKDAKATKKTNSGL